MKLCRHHFDELHTRWKDALAVVQKLLSTQDVLRLSPDEAQLVERFFVCVMNRALNFLSKLLWFGILNIFFVAAIIFIVFLALLKFPKLGLLKRGFLVLSLEIDKRSGDSRMGHE